jgi:uncharacterized protein YcgI (DUF1989 family)
MQSGNNLKAIKTIEVPGYSGKSLKVASGQYIRVTDIEGGQVGDMFAISVSDHMEFLSPSVTRLYNLSLFPKVGESFYSTRDREIVTFIEDNSPGCHDMLMASCNQKMFETFGLKDHPNCRDNYYKAAAEAGMARSAKPDPVNFFQNTPATPDGSISSYVTMTEPGDHVVLRAEMDVILILTVCSTEMINQGKSSPMKIEIFDERP